MGDFLQQVPLLKEIVNLFPAMDFEGQKLAEKLYQWIIILFAAVGFIWGFICQQFAQTVYILGAGVLLACIVILPPWHFFRRNPLEWQSSAEGKPTAPATTTTGSGRKKRN